MSDQIKDTNVPNSNEQEAGAEASEANPEVEALRAQLKEAEEGRAVAYADRDTLSGKLEQAEAIIAKQKITEQALRASVAEKDGELSEVHAVVERCQSDLKSANAKLVKEAAAKKTLEKELAQTQVELAETGRRLRFQAKLADTLGDEVEELEGKLAKSKEKLAKTQAKLKAERKKKEAATITALGIGILGASAVAARKASHRRA